MVEEILTLQMESGVLLILSAKVRQHAQFNLIFQHLHSSLPLLDQLSSLPPLRSRFSGGTHRLEFYTQDEMEKF